MRSTFLICPVRGADPKATEALVKRLEEHGWKVHWPPRDTPQNDPTGLNICCVNKDAIERAEFVHIVWDGNSQGCLFDLGMAFALGKKLIVVKVPPPTQGKSFQNMMIRLAYAVTENGLAVV